MHRYSYKELLDAAVNNPTDENLSALGEWFQEYGDQYWNGECYDADGRDLYPIYGEEDEDGCFPVVGWEFR